MPPTHAGRCRLSHSWPPTRGLTLRGNCEITKQLPGLTSPTHTHTLYTNLYLILLSRTWKRATLGIMTTLILFSLYLVQHRLHTNGAGIYKYKIHQIHFISLQKWDRESWEPRALCASSSRLAAWSKQMKHSASAGHVASIISLLHPHRLQLALPESVSSKSGAQTRVKAATLHFQADLYRVHATGLRVTGNKQKENNPPATSSPHDTPCIPNWHAYTMY